MKTFGEVVAGFGLTLPYGHHFPSSFAERLQACGVASPVAFDLPLPVIGVSFGLPIPASAGMAMPETTVDEDHLSPGRKDEVGTPWKIFAVEAVSVAQRKRDSSDEHLDTGVF